MMDRLDKIVAAAVGVAFAAGYAGPAAANIGLDTYLTVIQLADNKIKVLSNLPISPGLNGVYAIGPRAFPSPFPDPQPGAGLGGGGIVYPDLQSFNFVDPNDPGHNDTIYISPSGNHGTTSILIETDTTNLDLGVPSCPGPGYAIYCPIIAAGSSSTVHYRELTGPYASIEYDGNLTVKFIASPVPEPTSWALMMFGLLGIGAALRTSRRRFAA